MKKIIFMILVIFGLLCACSTQNSNQQQASDVITNESPVITNESAASPAQNSDNTDATNPIDEIAVYKAFVDTFDKGRDGMEHHFRDELNEEKLKALIADHQNINARNRNGETAIMHTTSADVLSAFIHAGADVNVKDNDGKTPLMHFVENKCFVESFSNMMIQNPRMNCLSMYDDTQDNDISCASVCLKILIDAGADVNAKDNDGKTAMMYVTGQTMIEEENDDSFAVKTLIDAGADINARAKHGKTPLMFAVDLATVQEMIHAGADVGAKDDRGRTALFHYVDTIANDARPADWNIVKLLIKSGASFKTKDNQGRTPLLYFIQNNVDLEIISEFVKLGASLKVADNQGKTPLMSYLQMFDPDLDTIKELVKLGASLNAKDNNGKSALDYYKEHCQEHEESDSSDDKDSDDEEEYENSPESCDYVDPEIVQYLTSNGHAQRKALSKSKLYGRK